MGGTCQTNVLDPIDQCALSWKIVVSEWWSVIGGGICLNRLAKLYMCMRRHYKHNEDGHMAPGMRVHGSILWSHSWIFITSIGLQVQQLL